MKTTCHGVQKKGERGFLKGGEREHGLERRGEE
jgi:hypothetical protein